MFGVWLKLYKSGIRFIIFFKKLFPFAFVGVTAKFYLLYANLTPSFGVPANDRSNKVAGT